MARRGSEVKVVWDQCPIVYEDGTRGTLRTGAVAGAFSDFVAGSPDGGEGVEVFCNHPTNGCPTTGVVPANRVTIAGRR